MRTPVIHIITPFTGKVGYFRIGILVAPRLAIVGRMGEKYRKMFFAACSAVATGITVGVRILLVYNITGVLGEVFRIPGFIEDRFPHPHTSMVAVAPHKITDIAIYTLRKFGSIIPELPAGGIDNDKQPKLVACIHECRVLRTMGVTDYFHSGITQFLCITPMNTVSNGIAYHRKVLMTVSANQRTFIRFAIQPETVLALKLYTTDTDTAAITVHHIAFAVADAYYQII